VSNENLRKKLRFSEFSTLKPGNHRRPARKRKKFTQPARAIAALRNCLGSAHRPTIRRDSPQCLKSILSIRAPLPPWTSGSGGLAYNSAGDLFISHANSVLEYNPGGSLIGTFASVTGATGLAFDSSGNLYAASGNNNAVFEYNSSGTLLNSQSVRLPASRLNSDQTAGACRKPSSQWRTLMMGCSHIIRGPA
jgi:hypothetical protein